MNRVKRFFSTLFLMVVFPAIAHAQLEDILSKFKADLSVQEVYDSNINLSPSNPQSDYITTITPRLRFSTSPKSPVTGEFLKTPTAEQNYGIDLDISAGFNFYAKTHDDNYTSLNGLLDVWYAMTQRLKFQVTDYLIRSNDIREPDYSPTAIPGQYLPSRTFTRVVWIRNVFTPSLQYQFGSEDFFTFNYRNNVYDIQSRLNQNSMENDFNPGIKYWFDIRNGVTFDYSLNLVNFERSPDLVGNMVKGRYIYRFNPETSIFGEYTQFWQNFDAPGIDYIVYHPSVGIEHAFSPTLNAKAQVGYYWEDPHRGSPQSGPSFDVQVKQQVVDKVTYTLAAQGGYQLSYTTSTNSGFVQFYRVIGSISYQLLRHLNVGFFSSYEWDKYPQTLTKQIDQIWQIGGSASYQPFKWLILSLGFDHLQNNSNVKGADYSDYRGIFRVTATY